MVASDFGDFDAIKFYSATKKLVSGYAYQGDHIIRYGEDIED